MGDPKLSFSCQKHPVPSPWDDVGLYKKVCVCSINAMGLMIHDYILYLSYSHQAASQLGSYDGAVLQYHINDDLKVHTQIYTQYMTRFFSVIDPVGLLQGRNPEKPGESGSYNHYNLGQ